MCMCVCVCVADIAVPNGEYVCVCVYVCVYVCVWQTLSCLMERAGDIYVTQILLCMCVYICMCVYVYVCACVYVCMCVCGRHRLV